jgi:hypothetical protein
MSQSDRSTRATKRSVARPTVRSWVRDVGEIGASPRADLGAGRVRPGCPAAGRAVRGGGAGDPVLGRRARLVRQHRPGRPLRAGRAARAGPGPAGAPGPGRLAADGGRARRLRGRDDLLVGVPRPAGPAAVPVAGRRDVAGVLPVRVRGGGAAAASAPDPDHRGHVAGRADRFGLRRGVRLGDLPDRFRDRFRNAVVGARERGLPGGRHRAGRCAAGGVGAQRLAYRTNVDLVAGRHGHQLGRQRPAHVRDRDRHRPAGRLDRPALDRRAGGHRGGRLAEPAPGGRPAPGARPGRCGAAGGAGLRLDGAAALRQLA